MAKSKRVAIEGNQAPGVLHDCKFETFNLNEKIEMIVHLRRDPDGKDLPSFAELGDQLSHKRKHLSRKEFEEYHGTSAEDVTKVMRFAEDYNLEITKVNSISQC